MDVHNLSVLGHANGFTLWHYVAISDPASVILTPGYFDAAADMLRPGDMIMVNATDCSGILVVSGVTESKVAVSVLCGLSGGWAA